MGWADMGAHTQLHDLTRPNDLTCVWAYFWGAGCSREEKYCTAAECNVAQITQTNTEIDMLRPFGTAVGVKIA